MNARGDKTVPETKIAGDSASDEVRDAIRGLVQRSLQGDDEAYAEIFRRFRDKVFRTCFRFTGDYDETMDLVQTVFIKAHRSLGSYREESSFATWISRIATNCGIDHVRARKRQAKVELDEALDVDASAAPEVDLSGRQLGPAATFANEELGRAIRDALDQVSDKHRTVFVLHCVEGTSYRDIADTLQISIGTVMSRLFHARRNLRKILAPYLGEATVRSLLREDEAEARSSGRRGAQGA